VGIVFTCHTFICHAANLYVTHKVVFWTNSEETLPKGSVADKSTSEKPSGGISDIGSIFNCIFPVGLVCVGLGLILCLGLSLGLDLACACAHVCVCVQVHMFACACARACRCIDMYRHAQANWTCDVTIIKQLLQYRAIYNRMLKGEWVFYVFVCVTTCAGAGNEIIEFWKYEKKIGALRKKYILEVCGVRVCL